MRTLIFSVLIFVVLPSFAQWEWEWQNPLPQGNTLQEIYFIDSEKGWAVGLCGVIMTTNDGGLYWEIQENSVDEDLNDIFVLDGDMIWAVGNNGTVLRSIDGGYIWDDHSINTDHDLNSVFFLNQMAGWTVGNYGRAFSTDDGGLTWNEMQTNIFIPLHDVYFLNDSTGWIAAGTEFYLDEEGYILETIDGGQNWYPVTDDSYSYEEFTFCDSLNGWAFTRYKGLSRTEDGGQSWEYEKGLFSLSTLRSACLLYPNTGFIYRQGLKKTVDGGLNWITVNTYPGPVVDFYFLNTKKGWACGWGGSILKTIDGGNSTIEYTQTCIPLGGIQHITDIQFIDESKGWAIGSRYILRTLDGGENWTGTYFPDNPYDILYFVDENHGWAPHSTSGLSYTSNGGESWEELPANGLASHSLRSLVFTDLMNGYACGNDGGIYKTQDGGFNWKKMDCPTYKDLWDICFPTPEKGWIVGRDGTILHSADSGNTWIAQTSANELGLHDVEFTDEKNGWASGFSENLICTMDGGETWTYKIVPSSDTYRYIGIEFSDSLHGYLGAQTNYTTEHNRFILYYTTDGGVNWSFKTYRVSNLIQELSFPENGIGWIAGYFGTICQFTNENIYVGIDEHEIIMEPKINNVNIYPNPGTNFMRFEYTLTCPAKVLLQVYSANGGIEYHIQDSQPGGLHKRVLDISDLSPGLYLYSITTDSERITGKFIVSNR